MRSLKNRLKDPSQTVIIFFARATAKNAITRCGTHVFLTKLQKLQELRASVKARVDSQQYFLLLTFLKYFLFIYAFDALFSIFRLLSAIF